MIKGDKIKLMKSMGVFTNIGEICEVVDVTTDGIISFKFGNGKHLGCMSYDEFEKYFELVESKRVWGKWRCKCLNHKYIGKFMFNIETQIEIRTNGKIVQARFEMGNGTYITSQAACHKDDKFSVDKGTLLAEKRLVAKILMDKAKSYAEIL